MKKIIALILVLSLSLFCFIGCGKKKKNEDPTPETPTTQTPAPQTPTEKTYTLATALLHSYSEDEGKTSDYVAALVLDSNNKIVAARLDCIEVTLTLVDGSIADVESVTSKVELGDGYSMTSGSFAKQTKAFEDAIVGKSADEVANLDLSLVAGCTMPYSPYSFKAVIAKAFASTNKSTFKTASTFTLGLAATMSVESGKVTTNYGATAVANGKILSTILDTSEASFSVNAGVIVAGTYEGTKVELGDDYSMTSGSFAKQTEAFENAVVGKTADEVANLDLSLVAGCTMPYSPYTFKAIIAKTFSNAR